MNRHWRTAWLAALCFAPSLAAFVQGMQLLGSVPTQTDTVQLSGTNTAWAALTPVGNQNRVRICVEAPPEVCRAWAFNGLHLSATQNGRPLTVAWEQPTGELTPFAPHNHDTYEFRQLAFVQVEPGVPVRIAARQKGEGAYNGDMAYLRVETDSFGSAIGAVFLLILVSPTLAVGGMLLLVRHLKRQTV